MPLAMYALRAFPGKRTQWSAPWSCKPATLGAGGLNHSPLGIPQAALRRRFFYAGLTPEQTGQTVYQRCLQRHAVMRKQAPIIGSRVANIS